MNINLSCPITGQKRDNNTIRTTATIVFLISTLIIVAQTLGADLIATIITALLTIDFTIRAFLKPKYSPLVMIAQKINKTLKIKPNIVDEGPKIFAARIGFLFTLTATILLFLGNVVAAIVVLGTLLICAALEGFLGFCLGCWMYTILPESIRNILTKKPA